MHLFAVWAVADDDELGCLSGGFDFILDGWPVLCEDGEVFFGGDSATEYYFDAGGWDAVGFPDVGVGEGRGELCVVEAGGEAVDFFGVDAEGLEAVGVVG